MSAPTCSSTPGLSHSGTGWIEKGSGNVRLRRTVEARGREAWGQALLNDEGKASDPLRVYAAEVSHCGGREDREDRMTGSLGHAKHCLNYLLQAAESVPGYDDIKSFGYFRSC